LKSATSITVVGAAALLALAQADESYSALSVSPICTHGLTTVEQDPRALLLLGDFGGIHRRLPHREVKA